MLLHRVTNAITSAKIRRPSRLRILRADGTGSPDEIPLPAAGVVLGADPACDVTLEDRAVSSRHVSIVPCDAGFDVNDLGSRNGTWLDGAQDLEGHRPARQHAPPRDDARADAPCRRGRRHPAERRHLLRRDARLERHHAPRLRGARAIRASRTPPCSCSARAGPARSSPRAPSTTPAAARRVRSWCSTAAPPARALVESTLFGHKRGAFTGAHADHPGAFALAHGGTLFLDEIGDLPLAMQPKLLRMLERGEVTPLGARKSESYDVRFVAATHRDLPAEVARGSFRADLYYRLAVVEVFLPPLRQRRSDIPDIVRAMLRAQGASDADVAGPSLDRLLAYAWPGNVRELRNVIARAAALALPGAKFAEMPVVVRVEATAEPEPLARADVPYHDAKDALLARFDHEYCTDLLRRAGGNLSQAARLAGPRAEVPLQGAGARGLPAGPRRARRRRSVDRRSVLRLLARPER